MTERVERWLASDKATRLLGWLTLGLVVLMMTLAGMTIPTIVSNTESSRRTDDLASCRATFRSEVDDRTVEVFAAFGETQDAQGRAVIASIRQDPTSLALIASDIETTIDARRAAVAALFDAADAYNAAVEFSRDDPDGFLATCRSAVSRAPR